MAKTSLLAKLGAGLLALIPFADVARANGILYIDAKVGVYGGAGPLQAIHFNDSSASNGMDSNDSIFPGLMGNGVAVYSNLNKTKLGNYKLNGDVRPDSSDIPYFVESIFSGNLNQSTNSWLELSLPYDGWKFENKPNLTLRETDVLGNPTGKAWDVRDVIANHSGRIDLDNLAPGSYSSNTPYATYQFDFNPVPEPGTLALLGTGALAVGLSAYLNRRRNRDGKVEK